MTGKMNWRKVTNQAKIKQREKEHRTAKEQELLRKLATEAIKSVQLNEPDLLPAPSKPKHKITSQVEMITPDLATKWLEGHTHNRELSHKKAMSYAADMKAGKWDLNGEPIIFDWDDRLQDGQHRLWACIESTRPFWCMVTQGIDPNTFITIDTGKSRNAADVLSMEGYQHRTTLAAAARLAIAYRNSTVRRNYKAGNREVLDYIRANSPLIEWTSKCRASPTVHKATTGLAAVLSIGSLTYPEQADTFLRLFKTGESLTVGSPILTIRNRLFTDRGLLGNERFELIVRAWNAFIENRMIMQAKTSPAAAFPKIKGDPQA